MSIRQHIVRTTARTTQTIKDRPAPSVWRRLFTKLRDPDLVIQREGGEAYLLRWHIVPRNNWFNIYLHCFVGYDDETMHCHPWHSVSVLLKGDLNEVTKDETGVNPIKVMRPVWRFVPKFRKASYRHQLKLNGSCDAPVALVLADNIKLIPSNAAWTLFITGPVCRTWGFYREVEGFVAYREYLARKKP